MTTALVLGAAFGLGLFAAYLGCARPGPTWRPSWSASTPRQCRIARDMTHGPNTRAGGWPPPSPRRRPRHLRADLRLVGRSIEELCAQRLVAGAVGLGVALAPGSLAWAGELGLPAGAWLAMGVLGAVVR